MAIYRRTGTITGLNYCRGVMVTLAERSGRDGKTNYKMTHSVIVAVILRIEVAMCIGVIFKAMIMINLVILQ